jgi:hypothetical protein
MDDNNNVVDSVKTISISMKSLKKLVIGGLMLAAGIYLPYVINAQISQMASDHALLLQLQKEVENPSNDTLGSAFDHQLLLKVKNESDRNNNTINGIANFLSTNQIPFDLQVKQFANQTAAQIASLQASKK